MLAAAVVLQALHGLPDFEAAQALRCDLRWKAACGLGLLDPGVRPVAADLLPAAAGALG